MRLIDADALMAVMYHEAFETDSDRQKWDSGCWIRYKMFEEHIANAPTVGEWIPVSERLPSEKKAVLICDSGGNRFAGELVLTDTGYKWKIPLFTVWMDIEDGDAWMPLPKPYKGGEDE